MDSRWALVGILLVLALFHTVKASHEDVFHGTWWVWVLEPRAIAWEAMAPADSYADCVERMLPSARLYYNHTTAWTQPLFKCEVKP